MVSRADLAFIILVVINSIVVFVLRSVGPYGGLGALVIFAYVAYWAFSIRHSLAVGLYRNQALGIGLVALGWGLFFAIPLASNSSISSYSASPLIAAFQAVAPFLPAVLTFYWVDASILAGRRSDPFLRDMLRWRRTRIVFWVLVVTGTVSVFIGTLLIPYSPQAGAVGPSFSKGLINTILTAIALFSEAGPFALGAVLLPIVARRSKDKSLRRHLLWFGLFAIIFFLLLARFLIPGVSSNTFFLEITGTAILVGASYCLYRSARALVPLNRLTLGGAGLDTSSALRRSPKWYKDLPHWK